MDFEQRLRALMARNAWTQAQVAEHLGVTQSWVSRILAGRSQRALSTFAQVVSRLEELEAAPQAQAS